MEPDRLPVLGKTNAEIALEAGSPGGMKRALSRRHVNMIAIAGMIVSQKLHSAETWFCLEMKALENEGLPSFYSRAPGYFLQPVTRWPLPDPLGR